MQVGRKHKAKGVAWASMPSFPWAGLGRELLGESDNGNQSRKGREGNSRCRSGWGHRVRLHSLVVEGPGSGGQHLGLALVSLLRTWTTRSTEPLWLSLIPRMGYLKDFASKIKWNNALTELIRARGRWGELNSQYPAPRSGWEGSSGEPWQHWLGFSFF